MQKKYLQNGKKNTEYKLLFTEDAKEEIIESYDYIFQVLKNHSAANNLLKGVVIEAQRISYSPYIYAEIELEDRLQRRYRRIPIKNYILLYTIDEEKKIIYVSHMYYAKKNYLSLRLY